MRYKMTLAYYIHHILLQFNDKYMTAIMHQNSTDSHLSVIIT